MLQEETKKEEKKSTAQCTSMLRGSRGLITFCTKREGHTGDHRGIRCQWNKTGRVKITEALAL